MTAEPGRRRTLVIEACAVTAAALLVRLVGLDHTAYVDELNHVIAASSLLDEGALLLESGLVYDRARLFTWMVAGSFLVFGESLPAARLPAVLGGTLLVTLTFLWVRTAFGRWEGWTAGILLLLAPQAIYHSQIARFYGFQALFVMGAALCAWVLATRRQWRRDEATLFGLAGLACALGAMAMQISSLVGLAAVGGWFAVALGVRAVRGDAPFHSAGRVLAVGGALVLAAGAALLLSGAWDAAVAGFGQGGLWAGDHEGNLRFYHDHLLSHYPLLWAPFPVIGLLALHRRPALVSLWLSVLGLVLLVHTLAAWKAERYVFYAIPYFLAAAGVVVGPLLRRIHREFREGVRRITGRRGSRFAPLIAGGLLVVSLLFAAWGNPAFPYTARMLVGDDASWPFPILYRGESDWEAVGEALDDRLRSAELVVTSTEQKARYFLGRGELILSLNYQGRGVDSEPNPEFHPNHKTDVPVISRPETVEGVVACHRSGLFLIEDNHWRRDWSVTDAAADRIESLARRVELDRGWRIHAFEWEHGVDFEEDGPACPPSHRVPTPARGGS